MAYYFTEEHQEIINNYVSDRYTEKERSRLYTQKLYPVFEILIFSVVKKYYPKNTGVLTPDRLQNLHIKLYEILETSRTTDKYYDESKGSAFSYLTVTIKFALIQSIRKEKKKNDLFLRVFDNDADGEFRNIDEMYSDDGIQEESLYHDIDGRSNILDLLIDYINTNVDVYFAVSTDQELAIIIMDAIANSSFDYSNKSLLEYILINYDLPADYVEVRFDTIFDQLKRIYQEYLSNYNEGKVSNEALFTNINQL